MVILKKDRIVIEHHCLCDPHSQLKEFRKVLMFLLREDLEDNKGQEFEGKPIDISGTLTELLVSMQEEEKEKEDK